MSRLSRNVPLLAFCQAMAMSGASLTVATAALVGFQLAEDKSLSSFPLAMQYIAIMLSSVPAAMLMNRIGRKPAFIFSTLFAFSGAAIAALSIIQQSFMGFVVGVALIGVFNSFANYYRFAAADVVPVSFKSRAISLVLAGGVIAAILGPNLARYTETSFIGIDFAGSYAALLVLYVLALVALVFLKLPKESHTQREGDDIQLNINSANNSDSINRAWREIIRQPTWQVSVICGMLGFAVMSFVMTATPLAMKHHDHVFSDTSFVIQWHVLAMFAPSFFTGSVIHKVGELKVMLLGVLLGFGCVMINLAGTSVWHFWLALLLLGLSWNFLYVGATSLLTQTYFPREKFKVQAINDFIIFSSVAFASLSAGYLQYHFGWRSVNIGVLPLLGIMLISIIWLSWQRRQKLIMDVL